MGHTFSAECQQQSIFNVEWCDIYDRSKLLVQLFGSNRDAEVRDVLDGAVSNDLLGLDGTR